MKKLIIGLLIITIIGIGSVYFLIPTKITVSTVKYVTAYQNSVLRFLADTQKINECFKNVATKNKKGFFYHGFIYTINRTLTNVTEINIHSDAIETNSQLITVNIYLDSCAIRWSAEVDANTYNPFARIRSYQKAVQLKESMGGLMEVIKQYLDNPINLYDFAIKEVQWQDSIIITTKIKTEQAPTVENIYKQINNLKVYSASQNAQIKNTPMLYSKKIDGKHYESMIGIPVNKSLKEIKDYTIKRMPFSGNMFVAEIKGGPTTIKRGIEQLTNYLNDTKRPSPAIPFEMIITDRLQQPDTSKWITKLYYPVM
jgi:hypothetical protein